MNKDNGIHVDSLYAMIWDLTNSMLIIFGSMEAFRENPDVVTEYYYMMSKAIKMAPLPFLASAAGMLECMYA